MQLYRFDNLSDFQVLDTFSSGCANIQTAIKPWGQFGVGAEPTQKNKIATSTNLEEILHNSITNHALWLMEIAVEHLDNTQPMVVALALPAVGIAGLLEAVDLLVDSCGEVCQIDIEASDISGRSFSIDFGSTVAGEMESLTCKLDTAKEPTTGRSHADSNPSAMIQLHRIRLCWPAGIACAQIKLASLHVYGNLRRTSNLIAGTNSCETR